MSICNAYVTADMALVAVDTAAANYRDPQNPIYLNVQKAMIHGDVLVASVGGLGLSVELHTALLRTGMFWRIDEVLAQLPSLLTAAEHLHHGAMKSEGVTADRPLIGQHQITVVGWSERLGRIKACVAELRPHGWQIDEIVNWSLSPKVSGITADDLSTISGMKATAAHQVAGAKEADSAIPIGGELILYQVVRDGITVRKLGAI
ncbi:hypothetical protein WCE37_03430 [Luteimonas sp. MJ250]|uniref:hypothetical protein n=1 Tax=Luteimonas sp. MJ250 TaxID=3129236 RepID=UPI0031BAFB15